MSFAGLGPTSARRPHEPAYRRAGRVCRRRLGRLARATSRRFPVLQRRRCLGALSSLAVRAGAPCPKRGGPPSCLKRPDLALPVQARGASGFPVRMNGRIRRGANAATESVPLYFVARMSEAKSGTTAPQFRFASCGLHACSDTASAPRGGSRSALVFPYPPLSVLASLSARPFPSSRRSSLIRIVRVEFSPCCDDCCRHG